MGSVDSMGRSTGLRSLRNMWAGSWTMYDLASHDSHYVSRLESAGSDPDKNLRTRLYGCGTEGQFPHWYRVPIMVFNAIAISLLIQTSAGERRPYLCARIAPHAVVQTAHRLHVAEAHSPIEGTPSGSWQKVVSVMTNSRMQAVNPDVFCIPSVPPRHSPMADFLNLG